MSQQLEGKGLPLRAVEVQFRYPQHAHRMEAFSLTAQRGECILLHGPSGCGKSTLARCFTGLIPHLYRGALSGQVWVAGLPTATTPLWRLSEHAGLVFQNPAAQLVGFTVEEEIIFGLENLGLPAPEIAARVEEALQRFGLAALRLRSPHTLSGGEQQKLALAAQMARQPSLLVLDEPLSMLDGAAVGDLVQHLKALSATGTTLIVSEHRAAPLRALPGLRCVELRPASAPVALPPLELPPVAPFCLEVSDLTVTFAQRRILHNLSFSLASGSIVALVGRNGVGKTTLLRALAGLQSHSGAITVDGASPELGMVFQNADWQLFNASVRDEILYRLPATPARYPQLLNALGLAQYENTPPLLLSEGEKKRLALAMILMRLPRHGVLLDEPALGQDADHKATLLRLARQVAAAGYLVIMTTHDLEMAAQADRLLVLGAGGLLVADGPPAQVLRDPAPWAAIGLPCLAIAEASV